MVKQKKSPEELKVNKILNRASSEVSGFAELLRRFERNISILGRSSKTFDNYSRHVAALALHFGTLPTELDPEQVKDYLFELQQRSKTPSQSYFKHTVYGLRFLLKTEGLPYGFLHLPTIAKVKKPPVILSREEIWRMLQAAELLKHKLLIGLIYGCGLRCMEVRSIELRHLDFDRKMLHIVQAKGGKDRYVPLSEHLIRGLKTFIKVENPDQYLFNGNQNRNVEEIDLKTDQSALQKPDFDFRYSQCQGHKPEEWIQKREQELLPCSYYHVVFTLPEELNGLAISQPALLYKTLFDATWATLNQFGKIEQIGLGMIAILHTWGQI